MSRYSIFSLLKNAATGHKKWARMWRDPEPKPEYDVVIIGGGGHGLATAYYLAKVHGVTNVAVLEKGYLGGGNTGRNTTIVRSNYLAPGNTLFYEKSMRLWEGLSQDLNFNVMLSQRGQLNLGHSDANMTVLSKRGNTMRANGIDADILTREEVQKIAPYFDYSPSARFPIYGALWQDRAGVARHDAVAWGYARGADSYGVDLIQNCEVLGFVKEGERISEPFRPDWMSVASVCPCHQWSSPDGGSMQPSAILLRHLPWSPARKMPRISPAPSAREYSVTSSSCPSRYMPRESLEPGVSPGAPR